MPSKVFMICNSYESGFGHGLANDGLDLSKTPHGDPEHGEAYQIGYEAGQEALAAKKQALELAQDIGDLVLHNAKVNGGRLADRPSEAV